MKGVERLILTAKKGYHKFYSPNNIVHTDYVLGVFGCIIHNSSSSLQPTPLTRLTQESVVFTY